MRLLVHIGRLTALLKGEQLGLFGQTQQVRVKPHARVTASGKIAQVAGHTASRARAEPKPEPKPKPIDPKVLAAAKKAYEAQVAAEERSMGVGYRRGGVTVSARDAETRAIEAFEAFPDDVKRAVIRGEPAPEPKPATRKADIALARTAHTAAEDADPATAEHLRRAALHLALGVDKADEARAEATRLVDVASGDPEWPPKPKRGKRYSKDEFRQLLRELDEVPSLKANLVALQRWEDKMRAPGQREVRPRLCRRGSAGRLPARTDARMA
jgi:hypothetical protein